MQLERRTIKSSFPRTLDLFFVVVVVRQHCQRKHEGHIAETDEKMSNKRLLKLSKQQHNKNRELSNM